MNPKAQSMNNIPQFTQLFFFFSHSALLQEYHASAIQIKTGLDAAPD